MIKITKRHNDSFNKIAYTYIQNKKEANKASLKNITLIF